MTVQKIDQFYVYEYWSVFQLKQFAWIFLRLKFDSISICLLSFDWRDSLRVGHDHTRNSSIMRLNKSLEPRVLAFHGQLQKSPQTNNSHNCSQTQREKTSTHFSRSLFLTSHPSRLTTHTCHLFPPKFSHFSTPTLSRLTPHRHRWRHLKLLLFSLALSLPHSLFLSSSSAAASLAPSRSLPLSRRFYLAHAS